MATGLTLIQTQTLTSTASSITFTNIPQNFKTLIVKYSARNSSADLPFNMQVNNGSGTQYSQYFHNDGGTKFAGRSTSGGSSAPYLYAAGTNQPAGVFSTCDVKFIDYAGSQTKQWFASYAILNSTSAYLVGRSAGYYTGVTTGITSITFSGVTFSIGTSFSLYGVGSPAMASGGTITYDGGYAYHTFTSTGSFLPSQQIKGAEMLLVAGGGGGGLNLGGGGGAGGLVFANSQTLNAGQTYTALIGAGGAGGILSTSTKSVNGSNSVLGSISAIGGGGGGDSYTDSPSFQNGRAGGSGGGGTGYYSNATNPGGSATQGSGINFVGYGNAGGSGPGNKTPPYGNASTGGGGGAGAAGANGGSSPWAGGKGGDGSLVYSSWGAITGTGELVGGSYYYAGGGGGSGASGTTRAVGGFGGGGAGGLDGGTDSTAGTANTGGGGGGSRGNNTDGKAGGSGLIIVRYPLS
jgi:hypothetical protein